MDLGKLTPTQRQRLAIVYVRQSSPGQVQRNPESTARQYEFVTRAVELGWPRQQVLVIDEDQGTSANGTAVRHAQDERVMVLAHHIFNLRSHPGFDRSL